MMIKTRICLTSGSHVDVQESFDDVGYAMSHSAPGWTFTLKLENGEPVSLVRDHVAYFTTCDHDEQQKAGQAFTYQEFIKAFNALNLGTHACESSHGGVAVFDSPSIPCKKMASLGLESRNWVFNAEAKILVFGGEELTLMAKLANTSPELRGGFDDERG